MRLPFVSRELHDQLVASERARALAAEAAVVAVEARYDKLLESLLAERKPNAPVPVKEPDPMQALIRERAGSNGVVRRALAKYVMQERAMGTDEAKIVDGLTHWHSSDDEGVDG